MLTPPLSVLDLAPVVEGASAADSFRNTRDLARHAEAWGYTRFWLAEHQPSLACGELRLGKPTNRRHAKAVAP